MKIRPFISLQETEFDDADRVADLIPVADNYSSEEEFDDADRVAGDVAEVPADPISREGWGPIEKWYETDYNRNLYLAPDQRNLPYPYRDKHDDVGTGDFAQALLQYSVGSGKTENISTYDEAKSINSSDVFRV